ncbi:MAG: ABC transporter permease subunit [Acidobacteria bacterium]|nr:ABC transporter permease subunit [Acidobacteriota bacterium]
MISRSKTPLWAWVVITLAAIFFILPMLAMARFAFQRVPVALLGRNTLFDRWTLDGLVDMFRDPDFRPALWLSLRISVLTVALTLLVMLPTALWVNVQAPRLRSMVETATLLPYVVPPIALVVGAGGAFRNLAPWFLRSDYCLVPFYAVLAMPFTFRSLDTGLRSIDLKTLIEASRSLGAPMPTTLLRIVVPNITSALSGTIFLTITVVLGEFTIASLLLKPTLPLYMSYSQGRNPQGALGLAVLLLALTTLLFFAATRLRRRGAERYTIRIGAMP